MSSNLTPCARSNAHTPHGNCPGTAPGEGEHTEILTSPGGPTLTCSAHGYQGYAPSCAECDRDRAAQAPPELLDDQIVIVEGREYIVRITARSCSGNKHHHPEAHADGTVPVEDTNPAAWPGRRWYNGEIPHHHHNEICDEAPRQVTLLPNFPLTPRHIHVYGAGGRCECGAWAETVPWARHPKPGKQVRRYHMPPDARHPEGWSYEKVEDAAPRPQATNGPEVRLLLHDDDEANVTLRPGQVYDLIVYRRAADLTPGLWRLRYEGRTPGAGLLFDDGGQAIILGAEDIRDARHAGPGEALHGRKATRAWQFRQARPEAGRAPG